MVVEPSAMGHDGQRARVRMGTPVAGWYGGAVFQENGSGMEVASGRIWDVLSSAGTAIA